MQNKYLLFFHIISDLLSILVSSWNISSAYVAERPMCTFVDITVFLIVCLRSLEGASQGLFVTFLRNNCE